MKKYIAVIISIVLLFSVGCQSSNNNPITTESVSQTNETSMSESNTNSSEPEQIYPLKVATREELKNEGLEFIGTIDENEAEGVMAHEEYRDENGHTYKYNSNTRELIGFSIFGVTAQKIENPTPDFKQQLRSIGEEFAKEYVDVSEYELIQDSYNESSNIYSCRYNKIIQGYPAADGFYIDVNSDGIIEYFAIYGKGMFDNVTVPEIDGDELTKKLEEKLKEMFPEYKSYNILLNILVYTESNGFEMYYDVVVEDKFSERLSVIIPV